MGNDDLLLAAGVIGAGALGAYVLFKDQIFPPAEGGIVDGDGNPISAKLTATEEQVTAETGVVNFILRTSLPDTKFAVYLDEGITNVTVTTGSTGRATWSSTFKLGTHTVHAESMGEIKVTSNAVSIEAVKEAAPEPVETTDVISITDFPNDVVGAGYVSMTGKIKRTTGSVISTPEGVAFTFTLYRKPSVLEDYKQVDQAVEYTNVYGKATVEFSVNELTFWDVDYKIIMEAVGTTSLPAYFKVRAVSDDPANTDALLHEIDYLTQTISVAKEYGGIKATVTTQSNLKTTALAFVVVVNVISGGGVSAGNQYQSATLQPGASTTNVFQFTNIPTGWTYTVSSWTQDTINSPKASYNNKVSKDITF